MWPGVGKWFESAAAIVFTSGRVKYWRIGGGAIGLLFLFLITRISGMLGYGLLIVIRWFLGAARDSGNGDWGPKGTRN